MLPLLPPYPSRIHSGCVWILPPRRKGPPALVAVQVQRLDGLTLVRRGPSNRQELSLRKRNKHIPLGQSAQLQLQQSFFSSPKCRYSLGKYHARDKPHTGWSYAKVAPGVWGCWCAQRPVVHGCDWKRHGWLHPFMILDLSIAWRWSTRCRGQHSAWIFWPTEMEWVAETCSPYSFGTAECPTSFQFGVYNPNQEGWIEAGWRKFPFMQPLPPLRV